MGSTDGDTNGGVILVVVLVVMAVNVMKETGFGENTMTACLGRLSNSILLPSVIANRGSTPLEVLPHKHLQHTSVRHLGSISHMNIFRIHYAP